jgi:hypothetical protein
VLRSCAHIADASSLADALKMVLLLLLLLLA